MKKLMAVALATMMTQQAMAANLIQIDENNDAKIYIDLDSIQADTLANGTPVMTAWVQREYKQARVLGDGKKYWSTKSFYYFDCRARKFHLEYYIVGYDKQDRAVASENYPSLSRYSSANWQRVVPDTTGEAQLNTVCLFAN